MTESRLAAILAEETPPFFRRPVAPRRRRRRPLLSFMRRAAVRVIYLLPLVALVWWALTSTEFSVVDVEVTGAERIAGEWVDEQLAPLRGRNLVLLRIDRVRQSLLLHPFVEAVQVRKDLPGRLLVEIEEHQPAALLVRGDERFLLTQDGLVFSRADRADERSLLRVVVEDDSLDRRISALELAQGPDALIGKRPELVPVALQTCSQLADIGLRWRTGLREVRILGRDDFELRFGSPPAQGVLPDSTSELRSVLVDSKSARKKAVLLDGLLPQIASRYSVDAYDLRFGNRIVLRGATEVVVTADDEGSIIGSGSEGV